VSAPAAPNEDLPTELPGVVVRRLTAVDAVRYRSVVRANAEHLGRDGDWQDEIAASIGDVEHRFGDAPDADRTFGIFEVGVLLGQVTLVHGAPPKWGLGYWLTDAATGRGVMTVSIRAVLTHARVTLGATEVLARVSHGNEASIAVLERLGFAPIARLTSSTRWRRVLS